MNLQQLNDAQLAAVTAPLGPTLVLAGAGSGKTRVLTNRILYLVQECGVSPSEILAITFTNKAANEMRRRLFDFCPDAKYMHISTIHSFCATLLRYEAKLLDRNSNFTIYDEDEKKSVIKKIVKEAFDDGDAKAVDGFCDSISSIKNNAPELLDGDLSALANSDEYFGSQIDKLSNMFDGDIGNDKIIDIIQSYTKKMTENNALDFDDLLYYVHKLFANSPEALDKYRERYKYILIDEFQDTNKVQYNIFRMLGEKYGNIFVVGDDDQSIYSWRGADVNNLKKFSVDFPQCKIYKLEQNYRSTKQILNVANAVIKKNAGRFEKELWTNNDAGVKPQLFSAYNESDEAYYVCEQIKQIYLLNRSGRWKDFAILMRVNALSRSFEQELQRNRIPYKVFGGFKFFERREIKDALAYMRLIVNPYDNEAFIRALNAPQKRGIGDTSIKKLLDLSAEYGISLLDVSSDERNLEIFNKPTRQKILAYHELIQKLIDISKRTSVKDFVHAMLELLNFRQILVAQGEEDRALNIDEFEQSVIDFEEIQPGATLSDYLQNVALAADIDEDSQTDYVTIATIHAVKGLEFNTVFVVGLEDGLFPTSRATYESDALREERRLMYVAVTRAEKRLYLTKTNSRFMWGRREKNAPSRYYSEVEQFLCAAKPAPTERQLADDRFLDKLINDDPIPSMPSVNPGKKKDELKVYRVGQKVQHKTFGNGMILRIGGDIADIIFENVGKKSLDLRFAPLTIIK